MLVRLRREREAGERAEEQRQQAIQDRQRVLDFMHLMAEALGEGLGRQELRSASSMPRSSAPGR